MGYKRKVPAARSNEKGFVKFTDKQLAVYYWLVSKAYYNNKERENHYYLYRDTFSYSQIARELGIGSVNTIKSAIKKLDDNQYIQVFEDVIKIPHKNYYTYLDSSLLKFFLKWTSQLGGEIILYYSVLKRFFELNIQNKRSTIFNTKLMVRILGHNSNDREVYLRYRLYLAFLREFNLVKVTESIKTEKSGQYVSYQLWEIKESITDKCSYQEEELSANEKILEKIKKDIDYSVE